MHGSSLYTPLHKAARNDSTTPGRGTRFGKAGSTKPPTSSSGVCIPLKTGAQSQAQIQRYNRLTADMKSFLRFAMLALVLVAVAMLSALTAMRFAIHGEEVAVPPLVGLGPAEAERNAAALGLQMTIERQYYSPQIAEGRIMSQLPLPGTKVRRGWQVRVAQSLGPTRVVIPDVTGQSERAAELNIRRRGLEVASMAEVEVPGIPADQVLAQSPPANATQVIAPNISLLLTATVEPQVFVMPSFVGQPLGTVSRTLEDAGFKLGNVSVAPPPIELVTPDASNPSATPSAPAQPSPASVIVAQSPPAGQKVISGATVNFEVR
jgi:eukaryotic-like serine/threonine-protein kinase